MHGAPAFKIFEQTLSEMTEGLKEEAARYELLEIENLKLRKESESIKLERDAANKTLNVSS